jgi:exodeoxyribonuclease V alpha subunit
VGPGNVLRDVIDSQAIATVRLSKIFRQAEASDIIRSAHMMNRGEMPQFQSFASNTDCKFIDADLTDDIRQTIETLVDPKSGYDPIRDIQVLTPMNRGDIGAQGLNDFLQNLLNPYHPGLAEYKKGGLVLRAGDKVIQCSNNYELGVFNGDIGFVAHTHVAGGKLVVNYPDGRQVSYSDEEAQDLKLAYAITIHKSQGSEFKVVIIPCSMAHRIMLQRNLFYTALTRAKKQAYFIGAKKALQVAIQTLSSQKRHTGLQDKIDRLFKEN